MAAPERARTGAPVEAVIRHVEHQAAGTVAGEELLDRLRPFAAGARRAYDCAERDQRRAEVSALRVARGRGGDVASDRGATAHLAVRDVVSDLCEHSVRASSQGGDRDHGADHDAVVVDA